MKVVALVSGGKDSCYSMHLCQKHGHEVVALANLLPADASVDELDSYMYQTVGHQLVAAYAACSGLPLYRRRIQGSSRSQGMSYSATEGDEVEDLLLLLAYIKVAHPEVQAVASGAIASDYQRIRVESVCSRLGLVSLAYLWHQPQDALLQDMITNNIEAVLVKVAALGLDPHKHLGRSLRQLQPHLRSLRDRFGCNVCGEGGEYETLTLDCPAFRHGRIVLDDWQVLLHSPDSIAPVGVLHPTAFHIEPKESPAAAAANTAASGDAPAAPAAPAAAAAEAAGSITEVPADWAPPAAALGTGGAAAGSAGGPPSCSAEWRAKVGVSTSQHHVHLLCSAHSRAQDTAAAAAAGAGPGDRAAAPFTEADTAAALEAALTAVSAAISGLGGRTTTSWDLACFVHLYLADMSHFGAANAAYCRHLPQTNPPSRACVQVPLPEGVPVLLDVLLACNRGQQATPQPLAGPGQQQQQQQQQPQQQPQQQQQQPDRRVLHVQSISSWAPSCIGPYSQATCCNGVIHMAGQIPLDPASMAIVGTPPAGSAGASNTTTTSSSPASLLIAAQAWRTLCSCQAVAVALRSCFASASLGLVVYLTEGCAAAGGRQLVQAALGAIWHDRSLLDAPDALPAALLAAAEAAAAAAGQPNSTGRAAEQPAAAAAAAGVGSGAGCCSGSDDAGSGQEPLIVDDYLLPPVVREPIRPAVVYLTVPVLPRGALLEVQPLLLDLALAQRSADASSSSDDEEAGVPVAQRAPTARLQKRQQQQQQQQQQEQLPAGVHVLVQQPWGGRWSRHLVLLQQPDAGAGSASERAAQAATAGSWLAQGAAARLARLANPGGAEKGAAAAVVSVRCWYDQALQAEVHAPGGSWVAALGGALPLPANLAGVQMVPVLGAAAEPWGSCWGIVEMLVCTDG